MLTTLTTLALTIALQCATVQLTLSNATLNPGQAQQITTQVMNCDTKKARLGLTVTVTDAVGNTDIIRNTIQNYAAGQTATFNDTYTVLASAPTGTYRVIAIVFDNSQGGSTEIARATQEFQVVAP